LIAFAAIQILFIFEGLSGERAGIRTLDPLIKSQLLYQLSYALDGRGLKASGRRGQPEKGGLRRFFAAKGLGRA
jgi:hypothetical protein